HYLRLHGADRRLWPAVHHRHPAGSDVHLLAAGLQMRVRADGPLTIVVALVAFGGAVALQAVRDARFIRGTDDVRTLLYVQSGEALKRLALEFDALASDVYWIRAIQHFGRERLARGERPPNYDLLFPLLDITTSL